LVKESCLKLVLFNSYSQYLTEEVSERSGDFILAHVFGTEKYAVKVGLLTKE
jgi:hypothetical protein